MECAGLLSKSKQTFAFLLTCVNGDIIIGVMDTSNGDDRVDQLAKYSPEQILEDLEPVVTTMREALDHGLSLADERTAGFEEDPWLHAHFVRTGVHDYFSVMPPEGFEVHRLALAGIEVIQGLRVVRVLKSQAGGVPKPGLNRARQSFWSNRELGITPTAVSSAGGNLILDWSTGAGQEIELALSEPAGVWRYQGVPKLRWRRRIEQSLELLRFVPEDGDIEVAPIFDLNDILGRSVNG